MLSKEWSMVTDMVIDIVLSISIGTNQQSYYYLWLLYHDILLVWPTVLWSSLQQVRQSWDFHSYLQKYSSFSRTCLCRFLFGPLSNLYHIVIRLFPRQLDSCNDRFTKFTDYQQWMKSIVLPMSGFTGQTYILYKVLYNSLPTCFLFDKK